MTAPNPVLADRRASPTSISPDTYSSSLSPPCSPHSLPMRSRLPYWAPVRIIHSRYSYGDRKAKSPGTKAETGGSGSRLQYS